jgi:uncharacterized protein HemX
MAKDFYIKAARRQARQLEAAKNLATANLNEARANRDPDTAAGYVQELADLSAAQENLSRLCNQYLQSQQPPAPVSKEERAARDWSRMDWQDVTDLARQSKYGRDIQPNDPGLIAGWQEAQRRRARGE